MHFCGLVRLATNFLVDTRGFIHILHRCVFGTDAVVWFIHPLPVKLKWQQNGIFEIVAWETQYYAYHGLLVVHAYTLFFLENKWTLICDTTKFLVRRIHWLQIDHSINSPRYDNQVNVLFKYFMEEFYHTQHVLANGRMHRSLKVKK